MLDGEGGRVVRLNSTVETLYGFVGEEDGSLSFLKFFSFLFRTRVSDYFFTN